MGLNTSVFLLHRTRLRIKRLQMLQWIINSNFYKEAGYLSLVETLDRLGATKIVVKTVPMTKRLIAEEENTSRATVDLSEIPEPYIDDSKPTIIMGSYTLAKIAADRGWTPGAFIQNLDCVSISNGWGAEHMLNADNRVLKIKDLFLTDDTFIRPIADSKCFTGKVFEPEEFSKWRNILLKMDPSDIMDAETLVLASSCKEIYSETRCFCIEDRVVTSSIYKVGRKVIYRPETDPDVIEYATALIQKWRPDKAFVLDIARGPMGLKVIETNCINAAGFYAADVGKLAMALEDRFGTNSLTNEGIA
jgi:ATP-grasp domain, R2K clade family 3